MGDESEALEVLPIHPDSPSAFRNKLWALIELFWEFMKRAALTAAIAVSAKATSSQGLLIITYIMMLMLWSWLTLSVQRQFFSERPYADLSTRRGCLMYFTMMVVILSAVSLSVWVLNLISGGAPLVPE